MPEAAATAGYPLNFDISFALRRARAGETPDIEFTYTGGGRRDEYVRTSDAPERYEDRSRRSVRNSSTREQSMRTIAVLTFVGILAVGGLLLYHAWPLEFLTGSEVSLWSDTEKSGVTDNRGVCEKLSTGELLC